MSSDAAKTHPYHMVEPSKWPFVGAVGGFTTAVGLIVWAKDGPSIPFFIGIAILLYTMYAWWKDVIAEANNGVDHTPEVKHGLRFGMILFITSEVMFFFAFFWAYFNSNIPALSFAASPVWPPEGIVPLKTWDVPFLNTLILLSSGATVTYAHHAIQLGDHKRCANGLILTVILGLIFTGFQAYEYIHATYGLSDGIYGSTFYLATGFHGAHVIIGTCFLLVCFLRVRKGDFSAKTHIGFEAAAWYWHFVDVVWLFLFCCVYWWGNFGFVFPE